MGDGVAHEECRHQVGDGPSLAAVRAEVERVEAARLPEVIEDGDVGEHVVQVVRVGGVLTARPLQDFVERMCAFVLILCSYLIRSGRVSVEPGTLRL